MKVQDWIIKDKPGKFFYRIIAILLNGNFMLYYLALWIERTFHPPGFGVFQYVTFRAAAAVITALLISFVVGPVIIRKLKAMQLGEQEKFELSGVGLHLDKKGTPTMGGLIVLTALLLPTILWADIQNMYIILIVVITAWLGCVGFLDDYLKVIKKFKRGLVGRYKIVGQVGIGLIVGLVIYFLPDAFPGDFDKYHTLTTVPFAKNINFDFGILYIPAVIFILTATSNAVNLTDGLDGLAIGTVGIATLALAILCYFSGNAFFAEYLNIMHLRGTDELTIFCAALVGAAMGFLWFNSYTATGWNSSASNHNIFYASTAANTGKWGSTDRSLSQWKTSSGGDEHSRDITITFSNATGGDLHLAGTSIGNQVLQGAPVSGITVDYDNQTRNGHYPYRGADEDTDFPLPVEFAEFDLYSRSRQVVLNWRTASETNNAGFELYRAPDSRSLKYSLVSSYRTHSELTGAGTSSTGKRYSFTDRDNVLEAGGKYWYKLVDVSRDGQRNEHEAKSVEIADEVAAVQIAGISPNPASSEMVLSFELAEPSVISVEIFGSDGRKALAAADNLAYNAGSQSLTLNVHELAAGSYRLQLTVNGVSRSEQFVIVR